jgi:oligopeptide transport system permease protein
MISFLLRRIAWMALTLWIVFTVTFFLMRAVPGGPLQGDRRMPAEVERNIAARYQLDRPLYEQYFNNLWRTLQLDFGPSFKLADFSVNDVIRQGFPVSATLGILSLLIALAVGLSAGVASAVWRQTGIDAAVMAIATLGIAVPNFVLAGAFLLVFVFTLNLFPVAGWGTLSHVALPAMCLAAPFAAYIARLTRTGMLEVLSQDYIRTAYAKGLPKKHVILRHALRGALLPVVSYLGPATAGILTGSLVLEQIFAIPGMGTHFIESAKTRDYTLAMGMVLVYTAILYTANTLVDLSYRLIDPRVKLE